MPGGLSTADDRRGSDWNRSADWRCPTKLREVVGETRLQESAIVKPDLAQFSVQRLCS
jgi:hypothetical protein